jgi:hypothetical protein
MSDKPARRGKKPLPVQVEMPLPPAAEIIEREAELAWWQRPPVVGAVAASAVLLAILALWGWLAVRAERARAAELAATLELETLRAPTQVRPLRIAPNPRSFSAAPDATIDWPDPPELLELHLPVAYASYTAYEVAVDKVDTGRVLLLNRLAPDSNRELRFSLNSSAFGPGEYRIELRGYTWRGERIESGWVRLVVR